METVSEGKKRLQFLNLPEKDDARFRSVVHAPRRDSSTTTTSDPATPRPSSQENFWRYTPSTERGAPYMSFGDRGTTASASPYGSLLRICRPMPTSRLHSGMLGIGPSKEPEALYVYWRALKFLDTAQLPTTGFGLRIKDAIFLEPSSVEFLDDRWPQITYSIDRRFDLTVKLWCHHDTVVQQVHVTAKAGYSHPPELELDLNMLHLTAMEDRPDLEEDQKRISVLMGCFKNGIAQELIWETEIESGVKPIPITYEFDETGSAEITVVFKLQMCSLRGDWTSYVTPWKDLDVDLVPSVSRNTGTHFDSDPELTRHFLRNLEHILSVCSIPLRPNPLEESPPSTPAFLDDEDPPITADATDEIENILLRSKERRSLAGLGPIALTCGDFGDHRVSVSGSFFAFMFMLEMHEKLSSVPEVRCRIHAVCQGHLEWVFKLGSTAAVSSNVSIDGERLKDIDKTDLPADSPANMPSHIIKATEYLKTFPDADDRAFVCVNLGRFAETWFRELAKKKNHLSPTWQHRNDSEIPVYRLSDQVWIWKALKSLEELLDEVRQTHNENPDPSWTVFLRVANNLPRQETRKSNSEPLLRFTAEELRRQNLRRFAIENDVIRKRMLSVTRTTRETRFLLHSRDTILYYGAEWGFFTGEEALWTQLIDVQIDHDDSSSNESQWDNPLRYGLAIEMARRGHQLDRSFSPSEMLSHAIQILLSSSSDNGLFPGQLDAFSKEPTLFHRERFRDFYFHVGFEIPYILLRTFCGLVRFDSLADEAEYGDTGKVERHPSVVQPQRSSATLRKATPYQSIKRKRSPNSHDVLLQRTGTSQGDGTTIAVQRILKRQNPYGRPDDWSNIVEVPEEWLYKYPDFFESQPVLFDDTMWEIYKKAPPTMEKIMDTAGFSRPGRNVPTFAGRCHITVDDIRKGRKQRKWSADEKSHCCDFDDLDVFWHYFQIQRFCLHMLSYIPELERVQMAQFFERHANIQASYLSDNTDPALNSWVTEVHFRFFHFCGSGEISAIPYKDGSMSPVRQLRAEACRTLGSDTYLVDAVISFRVVGDFFDRYWTCHALHSFADEQYHPLVNYRRSQKTHWQQRKVLEIILFNRILDTVRRHRKPRELRETFQLLVLLKNNIARLQGLIDQWQRRESSHGRGRPRWTRNDEQKYRQAIKQKMIQCEDHVRAIKAMAARIEFLIVRVTNAQDAIRSKKSLQEAGNITLFTYVTVFFLPVDLAVSIFSMNGMPPQIAVKHAVVVAVIAVLVTLGVLWCVLNRIFPTILRQMVGYIKGKRKLQQSGDADDSRASRRRKKVLGLRVLNSQTAGSQDHNQSTRLIEDLERQTGLARL
ncbi:hypothetical protein BO94DRAFT_587506 [Aspergillus sclerotioniger CBS 115572]|uniref:Uncharacterized protein n=1 Tax=Aspergillus sclerotioniger CBS 115572 TaxID=1450535 RepID=A0A317W626_9EURO|nr:hypothetical protein BO94DRAFT_587506 [Aspergillus sclerotioniger CBS 115572]PWY80762.1 hypothetical protein BO94DRAFT_587506 [Aspergillus sclerotioniger CBS 115572]